MEWFLEEDNGYYNLPVCKFCWLMAERSSNAVFGVPMMRKPEMHRLLTVSRWAQLVEDPVGL